METDSALVIGVLFFVGVYLILSQKKREMVFGVVIFSNAINLLLLVMSGVPEGRSSPILDGSSIKPPVDPLPQALILTAIVIGFGMLSLLITMVYKIPLRREDA
jgi:multicomponent Na+:H+ antiporter subunit C